MFVKFFFFSVGVFAGLTAAVLIGGVLNAAKANRPRLNGTRSRFRRSPIGQTVDALKPPTGVN
jgi:hypothetical protein